MKVILLQEVEKLGAEGSVVTVKDGFGRNYLIPRGLAKVATAGAIKAWQEERRQAGRKLAQRKDDAQRLAAELSSLELVVLAKVGEENRIFGTITVPQIVDALAHKGVTVDRKKVEIHEEVRHLGVYSAFVKLHPEVTAEVKFRVEGEGIVRQAEAEPEVESTPEADIASPDDDEAEA